MVYLVEQQLVPYGRMRELLADLLGASLSLGTLVAWVQQGAGALEPVEVRVKEALVRAPVPHNDETGVRQAGRLAWANVASTNRLTHYAIHAQRGHAATDTIGILPDYHGVSVHDGWKPYRANAQCRHALCNIHHLRELTFLEEQYQQVWAKDLKRLLRQMKAATDQARAQGDSCLAQPERDAFVAHYEALLAASLAANSHPPVAPSTWPPQAVACLQPAERHWLGREEVLAFLDDLTIPFDTN